MILQIRGLSQSGSLILMLRAWIPCLLPGTELITTGTLLQDTVDLRVAYRTPARNFSSRKLDLDQGTHTLTIHNASASPQAELGLDFVWIPQR